MYANGLLFGTWWGGLLSWASILLSALLCFGLGRLLAGRWSSAWGSPGGAGLGRPAPHALRPVRPLHRPAHPAHRVRPAQLRGGADPDARGAPLPGDRTRDGAVDLPHRGGGRRRMALAVGMGGGGLGGIAALAALVAAAAPGGAAMSRGPGAESSPGRPPASVPAGTREPGRSEPRAAGARPGRRLLRSDSRRGAPGGGLRDQLPPRRPPAGNGALPAAGPLRRRMAALGGLKVRASMVRARLWFDPQGQSSVAFFPLFLW